MDLLSFMAFSLFFRLKPFLAFARAKPAGFLGRKARRHGPINIFHLSILTRLYLPLSIFKLFLKL
jgi:hypothetical protein